MAEEQTLSAAGKNAASGGFFIKLLSGITVLALILRFIADWEMVRSGGGVNNALAPLSTSDLATYIKLGRECAAGNFPETFYYQPYYYAVFLALCNLVSGSSIWFVIIVQSLLSAATVFLTGLCGRKIFSDTGGLIAAFLCAVSSSLILYVPFHQNETLQTFHLVLLLYLTLKALEKQKLWLWSVTGLIAGIAILTRGNIWFIVPVILGGMIFYGRKEQIAWRKLFTFSGVFMAVILVEQLPFAIHNTRNTGTLSGPSTAANAVLALGNTPEAPAGGREPGGTAGAMTYPEAYHRMMRNTEGNFAKSVPQQMWEWFCNDPLAFCELQFRKILLFWDGREIPNNVSLDFDGIRCSMVLKLLIIGRNTFIFALGAAGLIFFLAELFRKKDSGLMMLYGFVLMFYGAVVVFYILSRFKAPVIPLLAIFAGGALWQWFRMIKNSAGEIRKRNILKVLLVILCGFWLSCAAYDSYRCLEPAVNRWIYPDGVILDMHGNNIQHFDYGPYPFGGWYCAELKTGSRIFKKFAALESVSFCNIGLMLRSNEPVEIVLSANGIPYRFTFPAIPPEKNDRRMVPMMVPLYGGQLEITVESVSGGEIWAVYDIQRDYGRSAFNGEILNGEWVVRAIVPR